MAEFHHTRRRTLLLSAAGAGLMLPTAAGFTAEPARQRSTNGAGKEKDVGAVEDLMREHGVLRRALLVYIETVPSCAPIRPVSRLTRLRARPSYSAPLARTITRGGLKSPTSFRLSKRRAGKPQATLMCSRRNTTEAARSPIISSPLPARGR